MHAIRRLPARDQGTTTGLRHNNVVRASRWGDEVVIIQEIRRAQPEGQADQRIGHACDRRIRHIFGSVHSASDGGRTYDEF